MAQEDSQKHTRSLHFSESSKKPDASQGAGQPLPRWQATSRPDASLRDMTEVNQKVMGSEQGEKRIRWAQPGVEEAGWDGGMSPSPALELSASLLPGGHKMARTPFAILPWLILNQ